MMWLTLCSTEEACVNVGDQASRLFYVETFNIHSEWYHVGSNPIQLDLACKEAAGVKQELLQMTTDTR
ncbi:hypothetical protein AOLI_G00031320 [Acnodon oligacanthus]